MYNNFLKRLIDLTATFFGLLLLSPVFLLLIFALFVANEGNPFFTQLRPGRYCHLFKVIKFKTMNC